MTERSIKINVPVLTRVEGEGALEIDVAGNKIERLHLKIFEPPRLFEKILVGRHYSEIPDMVARICGICPVAYQMSAILAIENLFNTETSEWINNMRRVFYCGEWIQSHALHIHLLALPDYFDADSVIELASKHPDIVHRGMELQSLGNRIIKLFSARSINPVGVKVGGFSHVPHPKKVEQLLELLERLEKPAQELLAWICTLKFPTEVRDILQFSLSEKQCYPMMSREIIGSKGQFHSIDDYLQHFQESQVDYSTAFHSLYHQQCYLVGPLARMNLNWQLLDEKVLAVLNTNNIHAPLQNSNSSIIARAAELYQAILTAKSILSHYQETNSPFVPVIAKKGIAVGCSEAPRGLLWHHYIFNENGEVKEANIVPPTSQNQAQIESDIRLTLEDTGLSKPTKVLKKVAEQVIRNYDPCISCATHFLRLKITRNGG